MCGIVGCAGNLEYRDKDALQTLMHLCELRGEDSAGYFTVTKDSDEAVAFKNVGPTRYMFDTVQWDKLSLYNKRVFVGHCRKATVGGVSRQTAHPFTFDHITGVHNGTLRNWRALPGLNEVTDSAMLYKNFAETGVRQTIEATDGAYALIWWDESEGVLNVLKNDERSLFYCFSEDCEKIFWASEAWMLSIALSRHGIKMANLAKEGKPKEFIRPVENDTWWRIRPGVKGDKDSLRFLEDIDLKGGVNKASSYSGGGSTSRPPFQSPFSWGLDNDPLDDNIPEHLKSGSAQRRPTDPERTPSADESSSTSGAETVLHSTSCKSGGSRTNKPTLTLVQTSKNDGSASQIEPFLRGNGNLVLDEDEYASLVDPNCVWCQTPHTFEELKDQGKLGEWVDDDSYICKDCLFDTATAGIF